jgi:hypothetical protein
METKALEELINVKIKSYDGELRIQAAAELAQLRSDLEEARKVIYDLYWNRSNAYAGAIAYLASHPKESK